MSAQERQHRMAYLDLLVQTLQEHEKNLDQLIGKLEVITSNLIKAVEMSDRNPIDRSIENKKVSRLVDAKEIPFWNRVKTRLIGSVPAFTTHELDYCYGHCKTHGYYLNHLHGYDRLLSCPKCRSDRLALSR